MRTYARHQFWYPVGDRHVLFLRGELGYTFAPRASAYRRNTCSGLAASSRSEVTPSRAWVCKRAAPWSGRVLATATIEYNHWLTQNWGAAIFTDVGDAADSWQRLDPVVGYGGIAGAARSARSHWISPEVIATGNCACTFPLPWHSNRRPPTRHGTSSKGQPFPESPARRGGSLPRCWFRFLS